MKLTICDERRGIFLKHDGCYGLIVLLASQGDAALMGLALVQVCMASDEPLHLKLGQENSNGPSLVVEALHLELTIGVHSSS